MTPVWRVGTLTLRLDFIQADGQVRARCRDLTACIRVGTDQWAATSLVGTPGRADAGEHTCLGCLRVRPQKLARQVELIADAQTRVSAKVCTR